MENITRETRVLKNESWNISELIQQINNRKLKKPKFQRKKKWLMLPNEKNENIPNDKKYIEFLYKTKNSVDPITFGENFETKLLENIDGNNRINAINTFLNKPFSLFPEYLNNLNKIIDTLDSLKNEDKIRLKEIFKEINYKNIFQFNRFGTNEHFNIEDKHNIRHKLSSTESELILDEIDKINKNHLSINRDGDTFLNIKINVNISSGYTIDELANIFIDINKYKNPLTNNEKLAADLYTSFDFKINNNILVRELKEEIQNYYEEKNKDECLEGYNYNIEEESFNAFDFIVSYQNYMSKKTSYCKKYQNNNNGNPTDIFYMIEPYHIKKDLSLFCKIFKCIYGNLESNKFNTNNINEFINNIEYSVDILNKIRIRILSNNEFNSFSKTALKKMSSLSLNTLYVLFINIIGYKQKNMKDDYIIKNIEKKILFHIMIKDINKDEDNFRIDNKKYDKLLFETGSAEIEKRTTTLLKEPSKYDSDITEKIFTDLLKIILLCQRKDDKYKSKKNRRKLCFTEQILYYYYYKNKVPQEYINNIFSNEHIIPFSLNYGDKLDIDRTGNMIPIIDKLNLSRNNNHINSYKKKEEEENIDYVKFIETIPTDDTYNLIVHDKKIINNEEYNNMCDKNETILIDNFINILF